MLNKKYRLKKNSAFNATYRLKNIISDNNICIYFGREKNNPDISTKFAFVVSKKIHKRAVVRNRIRRLMRECVRLMIKNNQSPALNKYLSIIFVAKYNAVHADFMQIDNSVKSLLDNNYKNY